MDQGSESSRPFATLSSLRVLWDESRSACIFFFAIYGWGGRGDSTCTSPSEWERCLPLAVRSSTSASADPPPSPPPAAMAGGSSSKKRSRRKRKRKRKPNPATQLTDDLLVGILSRVPYRSLCRFRCVSTRWRALISNPDYLRRLPQTLAGVFHRSPSTFNGGGSSESTPVPCCFTNVSGTGLPLIDPSFPFLPDREREHLILLDSCNGLLLCRSFRNTDEGLFDYLVLNPATEKWVAVPVSLRWPGKVQTVHLGFDPEFSSHFYIFEFQLDEDEDEDDGHVLGVKIYSSVTGVWCHKQTGWNIEIAPQYDFKSVFVNGVLYVIAVECVIGAVDVKGKTLRIIDFPHFKDSPFHVPGPGFIGLSQGLLHLASHADMVGDKLGIWVLEHKDSDEWTLKHTIGYKHLVGREHVHFGFHEFIVVAIHPDRNMVFFVFGSEKTLISYDMDSGRVHVIRNLGNIEFEYFLPYVPLFSKSLPDAGKQ